MHIKTNGERRPSIKFILNTVIFIIFHTGSINIFTRDPDLIEKKLDYIIEKCKESEWQDHLITPY